MIISGFPGIGKTTLANKYSNVIDMESSDYSYILTDKERKMSREELKGTKKNKENPRWPKNYIQEIIKNINKYDVILISHHPSVKQELEDRNIDFFLAIPELNCKEEYLERYKLRGNKDRWINEVIENYDLWITMDYDLKEEKIILKQGEYIEDVLKKMNVKLIEKEKN